MRKMNGYRDGGGGRGGGGDGREPLLQLPIFHFAPLSPPLPLLNISSHLPLEPKFVSLSTGHHFFRCV